MIDITLGELVSGYTALNIFAKNFCAEGNYYADLVVEVETSHDGNDYQSEKLYLQYDGDEHYFESNYDWDEGQRYIRIIGACYFEDINIPKINKTERTYIWRENNV